MELPLISQQRSRIESILLVVDNPVTSAHIARAVGIEPEEALHIIRAIAEEFNARGSGFDLRETDQGWRLYTRQDNASAVEAFILDGSQSRLSRAALETLTVIAYRQPVTRAQVAAVRGVNVDGVMRTLHMRGLIREVHQEGVAHQYETTELFLDLLGIDSVDRLPELAPLLPDVESILEEESF